MYIIHSLTAHNVLFAHIYSLYIMFSCVFCSRAAYRDTFHCVLYLYNYAHDKNNLTLQRKLITTTCIHDLSLWSLAKTTDEVVTLLDQ